MEDYDMVEEILWKILEEQKKTNKILESLVKNQNTLSADSDEQKKKILGVMAKQNPQFAGIFKQMGLM